MSDSLTVAECFKDTKAGLDYLASKGVINRDPDKATNYLYVSQVSEGVWHGLHASALGPPDHVESALRESSFDPRVWPFIQFVNSIPGYKTAYATKYSAHPERGGFVPYRNALHRVVETTPELSVMQTAHILAGACSELPPEYWTKFPRVKTDIRGVLAEMAVFAALESLENLPHGLSIHATPATPQEDLREGTDGFLDISVSGETLSTRFDVKSTQVLAAKALASANREPGKLYLHPPRAIENDEPMKNSLEVYPESIGNLIVQITTQLVAPSQTQAQTLTAA